MDDIPIIVFSNRLGKATLIGEGDKAMDITQNAVRRIRRIRARRSLPKGAGVRLGLGADSVRLSRDCSGRRETDFVVRSRGLPIFIDPRAICGWRILSCISPAAAVAPAARPEQGAARIMAAEEIVDESDADDIRSSLRSAVNAYLGMSPSVSSG